MAKHKKQRPCMLCLSPYRKEIVSLYKQGSDTSKIYRKYNVLMNYTASPKAFYMLVRKHVTQNHNTDAIVVVDPTGNITPATIENFGQRMLELGMAKIQNADPSAIQLKDVVAAQRLILDSKKLKLSENALESMLGQLFGPKIDPSKALEGELV